MLRTNNLSSLDIDEAVTGLLFSDFLFSDQFGGNLVRHDRGGGGPAISQITAAMS